MTEVVNEVVYRYQCKLCVLCVLVLLQISVYTVRLQGLKFFLEGEKAILINVNNT